MDSDEIERGDDAMVSDSNYLQLHFAFLEWAFGEDYLLHLFDPIALVDRWNELHSDNWIITQEELPHRNMKMMLELWDKEVSLMIATKMAEIRSARGVPR